MARNPGFLTDEDRKKLTGETSLDDYSNVSGWKGRIREGISQSYQDMALLDRSPHWDDEDFAKVFRDSHGNTPLLGYLSDDDVETGIGGVEAQSKMYGDTVQNFAANLKDLDINDGWQQSDEVEKEVQKMFVRNVVTVVTDVFELVGVTDDKVTEEFFEDIWPDKERALEIVKDELSND